MGRCNPADSNHHVSFRKWHFLCKRMRSSEGRRRVGIPERNSRLVLAMFPGSDALLSWNHHSNAGSAWLLNIAQEEWGETWLNEGATLVRFEMERRIRAQERGHLPLAERPLFLLRDELFERTIEYGLYPRRALYWTAGLTLVGWVIHRRAEMIRTHGTGRKRSIQRVS